MRNLLFLSNCFLEISENVRNLKNHEAAGLNRLTAEISKLSLDTIYNRTTYFVNGSLSNSVFSKHLETAEVVPILKSGKKGNCKIYRPISILSLPSKVFERIVLEKL